MISAQRKRYFMIAETLAGGLTQDEHDRIAKMPDWIMPIWLRSGIRLLNGVTPSEVERSALREFDLAQAKHLAGEG